MSEINRTFERVLLAATAVRDKQKFLKPPALFDSAVDKLSDWLGMCSEPSSDPVCPDQVMDRRSNSKPAGQESPDSGLVA